MTTWQRLQRLTLTKVGLLLEVMVALAVARLLVLLAPIAMITGWVNHPRLHTDASVAIAPDALRRIGGYLREAAHYTPWRSRCLEQALAGWLMLCRRGLSSTLHLGVAKEGDWLRAHAWLACAGVIVTGDQGRQQFTPLAQFGLPDK